MQSDETMNAYTTEFLKKIPSTRESPGIVLLDGHFSHISTEVRKIAKTIKKRKKKILKLN